MSSTPTLGRILTAMVTPFTANGTVDYDAAASLAAHLVDLGNDGLVVSGTTGESPTTSNEEKAQLLRTVVEAVGDRARIVAGVGSYDTAHTLHLAADAAKAGAHGLLVVTPYYNKPPQEGVYQHFRTVADSTELPVMLYDIPPRSSIPIEISTLLRLAEHPRIVAVKDAKGDFWAATEVMRRTDLQWYSGDDAANLGWLAHGAVGVVGVTSHVAAGEYKKMAEAVRSGNLSEAQRIHRDLAPAVNGVMTLTQGAIAVKAVLAHQGVIPRADVRLPLVQADEATHARIIAGVKESGLL